MSIYICGDHSAYVFNVWGNRILSDYLFFLIIMPILELIIELLDLFTFRNSNTTGWITDDFLKEFPKNIKPETASDILIVRKHTNKLKREILKKSLFSLVTRNM